MLLAWIAIGLEAIAISTSKEDCFSVVTKKLLRFVLIIDPGLVGQGRGLLAHACDLGGKSVPAWKTLWCRLV